jgi:hypothetical protein
MLRIRTLSGLTVLQQFMVLVTKPSHGLWDATKLHVEAYAPHIFSPCTHTLLQRGVSLCQSCP